MKHHTWVSAHVSPVTTYGTVGAFQLPPRFLQHVTSVWCVSVTPIKSMTCTWVASLIEMSHVGPLNTVAIGMKHLNKFYVPSVNDCTTFLVCSKLPHSHRNWSPPPSTVTSYTTLHRLSCLSGLCRRTRYFMPCSTGSTLYCPASYSIWPNFSNMGPSVHLTRMLLRWRVSFHHPCCPTGKTKYTMNTISETGYTFKAKSIFVTMFHQMQDNRRPCLVIGGPANPLVELIHPVIGLIPYLSINLCGGWFPSNLVIPAID